MNNGYPVRYADFFCGIGGFRIAMEQAGRACDTTVKCVFSCDIDEPCRKAYEANFAEVPAGDVTKTCASDIPDHDILLAGFPCQPFSIIGQRKGFEDTRGTLFFEIARILDERRPQVVVLENVKLLKGHNGGRTLARISSALRGLGYYVEHAVLNALDFGLPHKRERVFIVGLREPACFAWPRGGVPMKPLRELLEEDPPQRYYASDRIRARRLARHPRTVEPTIWHENKAGHVSAYPYSCALRAGASYNYLLVNGERRLTPREMLRLQGFPDDYRIVCNDSQTRKQAGNSLPVPVARAVLESVLNGLNGSAREDAHSANGLTLRQRHMVLEKSPTNEGRAKGAQAAHRRKVQAALCPE